MIWVAFISGLMIGVFFGMMILGILSVHRDREIYIKKGDNV